MQTSSIPPSMALCISSSNGTTGGVISKTHLSLLHQTNPTLVFSSINNKRSSSHVTGAKRFSSKTNRLDGKNKKGSGGISTTTKEEEILERERSERDAEEAEKRVLSDGGIGMDDGYFLPDLPGDKTDFWEGPQWDGFGFFLQYQWAFGIVFALIACAIAVSTYNEGATDFKKTTAYKESITQSREFLEEPETSDADVFEANPTEEAPSLE